MADSNPNSIMNMDPQGFMAALDELGIQGDERNRLVGMYRDQTASGQLASGLRGDVGEGMVRRSILPIATKQGMTGAEALMSGNFEFAVPEILSFLYQAPADAFAAYDASASGLPVSDEEFGQKMMNLGSVIGGSNVMAGSVGRGAKVPQSQKTEPPAIIRRDDQFRGKPESGREGGNMGISYMRPGQAPKDFAGQYAIRTTKADQITDIIESGLIRQQPGGYRKKEKDTLYFGLQGSPETKVGISPGNLTDTSPYALVGKADEVAKYNDKGGISLDALQHIWTMRDGKMVDILPDVRRANQRMAEFGNAPRYAKGGIVTDPEPFRAPPAQKTYNYHKPAEEPFRAPPVQKTFNYSKPAAAPAAAPNRAEAYRLATKAEAERPVLKAPKITYETTGQALSRLRGAADNYAQQNLERDRPSSDYVNMPLSEYLPKLARGVLPSALEMGIDAGEMADKAVKDPIGTGKAVLGGLGDLAVGLGSKISDSARSAMGLEVDPFASESKQRALNDLIDSAKGRYGFGEPGEFWKNLVDDPASYIADAAAVTTGGLSAAKKVANIADTRQLRRIANETRQTDVAPITPPAANPPDPFYDPLPPPPNFLMDRPEGYDPFATLRPQNNREATPPAAATNLGGRTPEEFNAELDRIFGPDNRTPDQIAADLEDLRRQNEVDYGLERLGNVTDPDTEAYAALETAYDNQVPEPYFLVPDNNMGGYGITPDQRALEQEQLLAAHQDYQQARANIDWLPYFDDNPLDDPAFRPLNYIDDIFPTILERAQRRDPLTDQEAFDVMTFERHGLDGVYDPTNTFENWGQQTNNDREGAERIAYLTGADRHAGQNPVAPVEGPYFADGFGFEYIDDTPDEYDIDFDEPDPFRYVTEDTAGSKPSQFRPRPLVRREEGIASMYSPTRRAVDQLRQSRFPDPVSMEKQLLALGAKPDELESLLKRIGTSDVAEGGIQKLRLAELADEAATEVQQFRRPDREYEDRHLPGAIDPHVTTFEAPGATPKGVDQHFGARVPGSSVLAHIRSAMFQTPDSNRPNVYHLSEIQSDWAQFRVKLFRTQKEVQDALLKIEELRAQVIDLSMLRDVTEEIKELEGRAYRTQDYGTREEFDKKYPAPYVKTTRKWHQLALKQALTEAVNSDAEYMSLATGEQAKSYVGGKLEGQQMFYDQMTPRELDDILTKFSKETGVEKPVLEYQFVYGNYGYGYEVPAIRLTDEFKEAMKKYGLPSFAKGGIVTLPT